MLENKILKDIKFALMSKNIETVGNLRSIWSIFNAPHSPITRMERKRYNFSITIFFIIYDYTKSRF